MNNYPSRVFLGAGLIALSFIFLINFSFTSALGVQINTPTIPIGANLSINTNHSLTSDYSYNSGLLQGLTPQQVANLFDASGYYLKTNPFGFYNSTNPSPVTNLSYAVTGNCPAGQVVMNTTNTEVQCVDPSTTFNSWVNTFNQFIAYTNKSNSFFVVNQFNGTNYSTSSPTGGSTTGNVMCASPSVHLDGNNSIRTRYYQIFAYNVTATGGRVYSPPVYYSWNDDVTCLFGSGKCWNTTTCSGGCQFKTSWTGATGASGYLVKKSMDNATWGQYKDTASTTNVCDYSDVDTTGAPWNGGNPSTPAVIYDQAVQGNGKYTSNGDIDIINNYGLKYNGATALLLDGFQNTIVLPGFNPKLTTGSLNTKVGYWIFPNDTISFNNTIVGSSIMVQGTGQVTGSTFVGNNLFNSFRGASGNGGATVIGQNNLNNISTIGGVTAIGTVIANRATSVGQSILIESSQSNLLGSAVSITRTKALGNGGTNCVGVLSDLYVLGDSFDCPTEATHTAVGIGSSVTLKNNSINFGGNSSTFYFTDMFPSQSQFSSTPRAFTYHSTDAVGTDKAGSDVILSAGISTGTANGGMIKLRTSQNSSTGSTPNTVYDAMTFDPSTNITWFAGNISATGVNFRTSVFDKSFLNGKTSTSPISGNIIPATALDFIKDASNYTDANGKIKDNAFDYSAVDVVYYPYQIQITSTDKDGNIITWNETDRTRPVIKTELSAEREIDLLRQGIYELKTQNTNILTCSKNSKDYPTYQTCLNNLVTVI